MDVLHTMFRLSVNAMFMFCVKKCAFRRLSNNQDAKKPARGGLDVGKVV
jgi:hypothetical protein